MEIRAKILHLQWDREEVKKDTFKIRIRKKRMNKFIINIKFWDTEKKGSIFGEKESIHLEIQKRKDQLLEKRKAYIWREGKERINFWRKRKHTFGEKEKKKVQLLRNKRKLPHYWKEFERKKRKNTLKITREKETDERIHVK